MFKNIEIACHSCLFLLASLPLYTIETIVINDSVQAYTLSTRLEFLEDPSQKLSIEEISSDGYDSGEQIDDLLVIGIRV